MLCRFDRAASAVLLVLACAVPGCRREPEAQRGAAGAARSELAPSPARQHPPLPEDEQLGRHATEQWEEHEQEEERNRRWCFDHERLPLHHGVLAALGRLRESYQRARSKRDVARARAQAEQRAPSLRKQFDEIDPWQNSSLLVADYAGLLEQLTQPSAGALSGNAGELRELQSELTRKLRELEHGLKESEGCEHED
jgi:hypothetical protein